MKTLDVCAGIGSFSEAAHRTGFTTAAQIEIDADRQRVLEKNFPHTQKLTDLTKATVDDLTEKHINILAGGTPCQDLSIAGYGKGLAGERSGLWFDYWRFARDLRPDWVVWENVPGALSNRKGEDFRVILQGLDELGYHVAWRVLDAQYFGVPQRRRRVFLVGHLRDGRAAKVLFESDSVFGHSKTRPTPEESPTRIAENSTGAAGFDVRNLSVNPELSATLQAKNTGGWSLNYINPIVVKIDNTRSNGWGVLEDGTTHTLGGSTDAVVVPFRMLGFGDYTQDDTASALKERDYKDATDLIVNQDGYRIRRLTPLECGRLQGFPDDWLDDLQLSDTKQYRMWGDSIALPVSQWIMARIAAYE